jgi:PAS domain S-box-containing protein
MVESAVQSHAEIVVGSDEKKLIRVLHVDDELGLLKVAKQCLELQGPFHVDTASSAEEALAKLEKEQYDAIVSDYQMPGKDGLEFLEMLRKNGNSIPFIMFTGKGREEVAVKAWSLGADHYVNKSGDPETVYYELAHCLRSSVEKRFAETQIRETVLKLQTIYQNAVEGISYVDAEENIVFANKAFADIVGYEPDQLVGMNLRRIVDDENWARIECETKRRRQGEPSRYEAEFRRSDGTVRNALISGAPLLDHDGRYAGTVGIVLDITEQKKTKEAIKESEEKIGHISRSASDCLVYLNSYGKILDVNDRALEVFGGSREELLGKHFSRIGVISLKDLPSIMKAFADGFTGKRPTLNVHIKNRKGKEIQLECSGSLMKNANETAMLVVARDVTEREEAEEAARVSEEKWRSMVEMAPDGMATIDMKGVFTSVNSAFLRLTGYERQNIVGKHFTKLQTIQPKDIPKYLKMMISALRGRLPEPFEYSYVRKDGTIGWGEAHIGPLKTNGKTIGYQVIFERSQNGRRQKRNCLKVKNVFVYSSKTCLSACL